MQQIPNCVISLQSNPTAIGTNSKLFTFTISLIISPLVGEESRCDAQVKINVLQTA